MRSEGRLLSKDSQVVYRMSMKYARLPFGGCCRLDAACGAVNQVFTKGHLALRGKQGALSRVFGVQLTFPETCH